MTDTTSAAPSDSEIEAAWTEATGGGFLPSPVDMLAFARTVIAKWGAPQPVAREPLSDEQAEAAAKALAACMDYPWEYMPEKGRQAMRKHAAAVVAAAQGITGDKVEPSA